MLSGRASRPRCSDSDDGLDGARTASLSLSLLAAAAQLNPLGALGFERSSGVDGHHNGVVTDQFEQVVPSLVKRGHSCTVASKYPEKS